MPYTNPEAGVYDFSGLSQWLVCQRKWWWYGVQSLVVDRPAAALVFGLAIHKGLETWFKGGDVTQMVESFRQSVIDEGGLPADQLRTLAKGELVLKAYAKTYPRPESFKVLATEQSFSLTMPDGSVLAGRMDGVVEWEDGRILVL